MTDDEKIDALRARYAAAAHAIQTGVAYDHGTWVPSEGHSEPDHSAKHLRTGINMAMVDSAGIVNALIAKGLLSELELFTAITEQAETEQARYEALLSARMGSKVTLG